MKASACIQCIPLSCCEQSAVKLPPVRASAKIQVKFSSVGNKTTSQPARSETASATPKPLTAAADSKTAPGDKASPSEVETEVSVLLKEKGVFITLPYMPT